MDKDRLISRIREIYPDLKIKKSERNNFGQNNDVLIINDLFVFRFPKYNEGIENLVRELSLLNMLENKITVSIPSPLYTSLDVKLVGMAFAGYRMLGGEPMWKKDLEGVNQHGLKKIASQLVTFLVELHSIRVERFTTVIQHKTESPLFEIQSLYSRLENTVFPYMSQKSRETVSLDFMTFIKENSSSIAKPTLIHGDFGASNILWNAENETITGVIDFGSTGLGDPAYDLAGLLSSYGETFFDMCIHLYPEGEKIKERVKFYRSTFALQEALHGIENNDEEAFRIGIAAYI